MQQRPLWNRKKLRGRQAICRRNQKIAANCGDLAYTKSRKILPGSKEHSSTQTQGDLKWRRLVCSWSLGSRNQECRKGQSEAWDWAREVNRARAWEGHKKTAGKEIDDCGGQKTEHHIFRIKTTLCRRWEVSKHSRRGGILAQGKRALHWTLCGSWR